MPRTAHNESAYLTSAAALSMNAALPWDLSCSGTPLPTPSTHVSIQGLPRCTAMTLA